LNTLTTIVYILIQYRQYATAYGFSLFITIPEASLHNTGLVCIVINKSVEITSYIIFLFFTVKADKLDVYVRPPIRKFIHIKLFGP